MPISTAIPLPPDGTPFIDPTTGAVSVQWQNYLLALENALGAGVPPINAQYWVSTTDTELTNERNIGALSTGHLSITTAAGVAMPSTATTIPAADISGVLDVDQGGTGRDTLTANGVVYGTGTNVAGVTTQGAANSVLVGDEGPPAFSSTPTLDTLALVGLLDISDANAGQIQFPASQNASSDANTLDDYEEGLWTPVIGGSGGTSGQTYTTQNGRYVKTGKYVAASCLVELSAEGTITGNAQIQGLPFTAVNSSQNIHVGAVRWHLLATNWVSIVANVGTNATAANLIGATAAAANNSTALTASDIGDTTFFVVTLGYEATA